MIPEILLLAAALLLAYAWLLYPLLLGRLARRKAPAAAPGPAAAPRVAVLFSAYNEEAHLEARLANLQAARSDVPGLAILVGVDASSDGTARIARARAASDSRIRVVESAERRGKTAMLKALVRDVEADLLVFTDANTAFAPDALRRLLEPFADPGVGGVCGRLIFTAEGAGPAGAPVPEGAYWRWETRLKEQESRLDSCLGANGAIYAIRRDLFWGELPDNTIIDDFVIGMKVREQGYRVLYEPAAVAREEAPEAVKDEWQRRVRIGAGAYQALRLCRRCLGPRYGRFAWMFWSHKVLRWLTPHLMALLLAGGAAALALRAAGIGLRPAPAAMAIDAVLAGAMLAFLVAAGLGEVARRAGHSRPRLTLCLYFLAMQAALFAGFIRFCRGNLAGHWTRTARGGRGAAPVAGSSE